MSNTTNTFKERTYSSLNVLDATIIGLLKVIHNDKHLIDFN